MAVVVEVHWAVRVEMEVDRRPSIHPMMPVAVEAGASRSIAWGHALRSEEEVVADIRTITVVQQAVRVVDASC